MEMLSLGRIAGHRGRNGELTVKVLGGDGSLWTELQQVWIGDESGDDGGIFRIESSRAYKDRLVLKLVGIEGAEGAAALRGKIVKARDEDAPRLPEDVYYVDRLVGMQVRLEDGRMLGRVTDLIRTGGADLLVVREAVEGSVSDEEDDGRDAPEIMIPLAKQIVIEVRDDEGQITVRPPEGLLELNRPGRPAAKDEQTR